MNKTPHTQAADAEQRIAALAGRLRVIEQELDELTGGQVDTITGADGVPFLLREAQKKLRLQEAAQRQAAEMQMAILNALPAHIALLDANGVILAVNEAWRRFSSANVQQGDESFVGQNYLSVCECAHGYCAEEAQAVADGIRSVLHDGQKEFSLEYPCHSSTEERWFRLMVTPLSEQPMASAVVMHVNVTERKQAEEALRVSEERFRLMVEGSDQVLFFTHDREHRFEYLSPSTLAVLGYEPVELIGQPYDVLVIPDDPANDHVSERTDKALQDGKPCEPYQAVVRHKDGRRLVFEISESPMVKDGRIFGLQGFARDVTERETARSALAASEWEFRNLAESMPQIVWITGPDGWNIYFNQHWMEYTGLTLEESLGHGWIKPFHPDDQQRAWDAWQKATTTLSIYALECRLRRADGSYRWWLLRGEPQRNEAGQVIKWFGTCTDIHDLKVAEMEILRTNRALKLLSSCNEALIRSETEMELLTDICRIAVEVGGYQLAWVGYALDDAGKTIKPQAHAGAEDGYLTKIALSWSEDAPTGQGPAGKSIRSGEQIVIPDVETDGSFQPWLDEARERGLRGVISLPLKDATRTFGVLVLYLPEARHPQADELNVLQELADDMAFGIVNHRERHARRLMQTALVNVAAAVSATTGREFFEQLARNMAQALGAQASFVSQFLPGEPRRARTIAAVVDGTLIDNYDYEIEGTPCERLLTSDTCVVRSEADQQFACAPGLAALGAQSYVGRRLDSSTGKHLGLLFVIFREPLQEPDLVVAMLQIFAARAAAELERQETDARVREQAALLDKARDAILVRDLDHKILYWNHSAERLYGWSAAEALGRNVRELIYRDTGSFDAAFNILMACNEWVGEIEQVTKEGKLVTVECRWSLVRDEQGIPQSVLAINTDITERKKIEAQYLRAQRMESIGTLAGGIAHDLNNVLAPIMMSIELLKMQEKDAQRINILTIIESSAKRGADMVRQVLSFARGVDGQQVEVPVGHLIKEIQKIVHDTFLKNIEVRSHIASDLWLVKGDPTQLHQVLLNLCVNARDAMPDGGSLTLSAGNLMLDEQYAGMNIEAKPGPYVCIQVEDSGTGMSPEVMERVFEPFFTTKELGKGTGLGLSTTIAIIRSHGGFIRVYSEVGMGSRFLVYLPANTEPIAAENDAASMDLPRGHGELVLVVDDESSVREITRQTLETFGYHVVMASDGVEAASIYANRKHEIAVVLTDMMMPLMDGPTTIHVLLRMNPQVRIIAASGLNANGMVAKAHSAGVKHFIPKPYTAETLLKTLRDALEA
jgi:PAS domain S-box-containing protein